MSHAILALPVSSSGASPQILVSLNEFEWNNKINLLQELIGQQTVIASRGAITQYHRISQMDSVNSLVLGL